MFSGDAGNQLALMKKWYRALLQRADEFARRDRFVLFELIHGKKNNW